MCGRYASWSDKNRILEHYGLQEGPDIRRGYNITPSQDIPIIRLNDGKRELINAHWGFIPHWAKDKKLQPANTRSDSVVVKPFFKHAFRNNRCLFPVDGFYEWKETKTGKQPYFIKLVDREIFSFAGIWSHWQDMDTAALITCEPNKVMAAIHDRMPVILDPDEYDQWLENGARDLLKPYKGKMETWPVSTRVNRPGNQGPELIQPL
jgi:putative SOS response-associated peptidase YedK